MRRSKYYSAIMYVLVISFMMATMISCGSMKNIAKEWEKRTPEERGRITLNLAQGIVATCFETGQTFVNKDPVKYQTEWKEKVLPAIDLANKSIATALTVLKNGGYLTQEDVVTRVAPNIKAITDLLAGWGIDVSKMKI